MRRVGERTPLVVPHEFTDALWQADLLGSRLFRHDQAAAVATDAVMGKAGRRR